MAVLLPPQPFGQPPDSAFWNDWYERLRTVVNSGAISVLWGNINFAGSDITSIASRNHNNLQSFQGGAAGEYYHLTSAQYNNVNLLPAAGTLALKTFSSAAADPTTADIPAGEWRVQKNTTSGQLRLWANDGGTIKSVLLT